MRLILDANVLVALAIPTSASERAAERFTAWSRAGQEFFAPLLWNYEAVSAIRKFVSSGMLTNREASAAVGHLMKIGVRSVAPTAGLHRSALAWAELLQNFVAYDAAYLAVAEKLNAPFWTVDSKLVKRARAIGIDWIYDLTESN